MLLDTELRQIFLGEVAAYLEILEDPGASAEAQGDAAHGLKGAAGMLGFSELQDLAGRIEGALRRGESGPRDEHLPKLRAIARSLAEEDGSAPAGSSGSPQVAEPCTRLDENAASEPPATFPAASPTEPPLEPIEEPLAEPLDPGPDARAACVGQTPPAEDLDPREAAFAAEFDAETAAMLRTFFAEEAAEHLAEMERALALLEERPTDSELVGALFRASHTLKGAAATVGLGRISEAAHRLEDRFEEIRDRGEPATPARLSSLVRATDLLRAMVDARDTSSHRRILDEIRELVAASSGAAAQSAPSRHEPPATAPPPSTLEPIVDAPSSGDWDADTQRILQETFAAEARELLDQIDPLVETLSAGGRDASDLDLLFRLIHTLKGSSAAVGMPGIPEAAHILEDHVSLVRDKRPIPPPGPDLLAVLATLHDLVDAALQGLPTGPLLEAFRGAMMGRRLSLPAPPQGRPLQASRPSRAPTPMPTPALASLTVPEEVSGELERRGRPDRRAQDRRQDEDRLIRVNAEHFDALLSHVGEIVFPRTHNE
ncbi:MAG: Hpt domain-containing protein, partial [Polyangia bacterium]|nr:Hpt domain-containing protein [Polyangia bacterium]